MNFRQQLRSARAWWAGLGLVLCCLTIGGLAPSGTVSATASTLSLTVSSSTLSLDLKPVSLEGTFARSSGSLNIGVNTNNSSGFTLKFAASTADDRTLSDENGNGLSSITTAIDADTFSGSDTTYNNKWGYLPSRMCTISNNVTTCTNNTTNYYPAPTAVNVGGDTLDITNTANISNASSDDSTYTIAIGARANTNTKATTYEGTFVITAVANPIPYTITYNKNTEDTVTNMPAPSSGSVTTEIATNAVSDKVPARTGYKFLGWCSTTTVVADNADTCSGTIYNPNGDGTNRNYTLDQTGNNTEITLYAMWQRTYDITFIASSNINSIMVADGSNNYKPQYAINGTNNGSTSLSVPANTKLIVTVIPESEYMLDTWSSDSNSTIRLASTTLLTTTYTVGTTNETLTATGKSGSYDIMQNLDLSIKDENNPNESKYCPTTGINVTDSRDKKSYTVAMFGNYCYMLSNLRLDGGTVLDDVTSNVTAEYALPANTDSTAHGWANDYCKPYMASKNGEYYYNWPAATARTNDTVGTSSCSNDTNNSVGDICPANWALPNYNNDVTASALWNSGENPGMLATSGDFVSGSQYDLGSYGVWWSSARSDNGNAGYLGFGGTSAYLNSVSKYSGFSVRCMRSS